MPRRYYSSTAARTTLASGVNNSTTTFSVTAVSGWPTSFPYTLVIDQDTVNEEIVEVTARSGTTLTVVRGVDNTAAVAHSAGAAVNHGVSARDFDEPNAFINGTGTVTDTLLATGSVTETKIADSAVTSAKIANGTIVNDDINASAAIAQSKISNLTSDLASKVDYALAANAQSGTGASAYTFVLADATRLTTATGTSAKTFTIPPQASVAWVANSIIRVANYGAGNLTIAGGSGVTVTNASKTLAQFESAALIRTASNAWTLVPFSGGVGNADFSNTASGTYSDGGINYKWIQFTASGTLTVTKAGFADVLVVAGGGGGGRNEGGGGGGGGYFEKQVYLDTTGTFTVTVGAGGAGGDNVTQSEGRQGNHSGIASITGCLGGGGGGARTTSTTWTDGAFGASGGGGGGTNTGGSSNGSAGLTGEGSNGSGGTPSTGGAGGGAGGVASARTGGVGISSSITNTSVGRAGGGGGGAFSGTGTATDGGGTGSPTSTAGDNGDANTGGGGGGAGSNSNTGGAGGSGVVIVRVRT